MRLTFWPFGGGELETDDFAFVSVQAPELPFVPMPKIPRLNRDIIITEKIDGTNASVWIDGDGTVRAASRTRWITPGKGSDNYGFAAWVEENQDGLISGLGPGHHFGEWYGKGINRGYGMCERRFALFNVSRWGPQESGYVPPLPPGVDVVPVLYRGPMSQVEISNALVTLKVTGSKIVPGYMKPEGVVVFHVAANQLFKVTLENDESPKSITTKAA